MAVSRAAGLRAHSLVVGTCTVAVTIDGIATVLAVEPVEAVVSSDDSALSMSGGISGELASLAGASYGHEARRLAPAPVGTVVVTGPGALPVRHVLHAITVDWDRNIRPTARTVRQLGRQIFVRCEGLALRSIAIPAIATGAAGFSAQESARIVGSALMQHLRSKTVLERIVFTLPDAEAYLYFSRELHTLAGLPPPPLGTIVLSADWDPDVVGLEKAAAPERSRTSSPPPPVSARMESTRPAARGRWWPSWKRKPAVDTSDVEMVATSTRGPVDDRSRPVLAKRYVLLEELGRGGCGVVDLAWDLILRRSVAIKRLHRAMGDPDLLRREASLAMDLTHEGIVRLYHFEPGSGDDGPFLVMEHVPWSTGEKWIADAGQAGLPPSIVLEVGARACDALAYAHGRGVLHLDIKPGNLFVDPAAECTKLVDFGLARAVAQGQRAFQHLPAGTPAYMPPEQRSPGARLTPATDVYQLTATLWDFLTGDVPSRTNEATPEAVRRRGWPAAFEALARGLAPNPDDRPRDALALRSVIEHALAAV